MYDSSSVRARRARRATRSKPPARRSLAGIGASPAPIRSGAVRRWAHSPGPWLGLAVGRRCGAGDGATAGPRAARRWPPKRCRILAIGASIATSGRRAPAGGCRAVRRSPPEARSRSPGRSRSSPVADASVAHPREVAPVSVDYQVRAARITDIDRLVALCAGTSSMDDGDGPARRARPPPPARLPAAGERRSSPRSARDDRRRRRSSRSGRRSAPAGSSAPSTSSCRSRRHDVGRRRPTSLIEEVLRSARNKGCASRRGGPPDRPGRAGSLGAARLPPRPAVLLSDPSRRPGPPSADHDRSDHRSTSRRIALRRDGRPSTSSRSQRGQERRRLRGRGEHLLRGQGGRRGHRLRHAPEVGHRRAGTSCAPTRTPASTPTTRTSATSTTSSRATATRS